MLTNSQVTVYSRRIGQWLWDNSCYNLGFPVLSLFSHLYSISYILLAVVVEIVVVISLLFS